MHKFYSHNYWNFPPRISMQAAAASACSSQFSHTGGYGSLIKQLAYNNNNVCVCEKRFGNAPDTHAGRDCARWFFSLVPAWRTVQKFIWLKFSRQRQKNKQTQPKISHWEFCIYFGRNYVITVRWSRLSLSLSECDKMLFPPRDERKRDVRCHYFPIKGRLGKQKKDVLGFWRVW